MIRRVNRLWNIRGGKMVQHQVHVLVTPRVVVRNRTFDIYRSKNNVNCTFKNIKTSLFCVHLAANTLKMNCIFSQWISSINREALPLIRNPNSFKIKALTEKLFTSMLPLKDTSTCTRSLLYLFLLILFLPYQFLLAFLYLQHRLGIYVDSCK